MRRFALLVVLALPFLLGFSTSSVAKSTFTVSDALAALITQIDEIYLSRKNENFRDVIRTRSPAVPAVLLGVAVYGQTRHVGELPDAVERIMVLEKEIYGFLDFILRSHDYRDTNGKEISTEELYAGVFLPSVEGESNALMLQMYGLDPAKVQHGLCLDLVELSPSRRSLPGPVAPADHGPFSAGGEDLSDPLP